LPSPRDGAKKTTMPDQALKLPVPRRVASPPQGPAASIPAAFARGASALVAPASAPPVGVARARTGLAPAPLTQAGVALASLALARMALVIAPLALATVLLAACSTDLSRTFGFTRDAPDEFTVTTQTPLSMPPEFNIRPPNPGSARPGQLSTQRQAEEALVPQTALTGVPSGQASSGQAALVQAAGPAAPPNIRAQVNGEAAAEQQQSQGFVDTLMFWRDKPAPGVVVDPQREAQRIKENAALGRNQDTGDTPIIQPKSKGWLGSLF